MKQGDRNDDAHNEHIDEEKELKKNVPTKHIF
jgi:hypothetical protein